MAERRRFRPLCDVSDEGDVIDDLFSASDGMSVKSRLVSTEVGVSGRVVVGISGGGSDVAVGVGTGVGAGGGDCNGTVPTARVTNMVATANGVSAIDRSQTLGDVE